MSEAILSETALRTLKWLRDNPHHFAQRLADGRVITTQPKEKWNQLELRGRSARHRTTSAAWEELAPYKEVPREPSDRMWVPNAAGLALLAKHA
jgi:hypothetical protein